MDHPASAGMGKDFAPCAVPGQGVTLPGGFSRISPRRREKPMGSRESVRSMTAVKRRAGLHNQKPHGCPSRKPPRQPRGQTSWAVLPSLPTPVAGGHHGCEDDQRQHYPQQNNAKRSWGRRRGKGETFGTGQSRRLFLNTIPITTRGYITRARLSRFCSQQGKLGTRWHRRDVLRGIAGPRRAPREDWKQCGLRTP